ncbi:MAG: Coenzyme F420 hydrogenase/dehydrogenase, beta subunit C-terminal domain, partial [Chloroflexi bacterium]|nr:Coenzyme F420 hydrogenase/dehydrogenase, beta subunit C-terminal domain [Chloroflexota bacterium]
VPNNAVMKEVESRGLKRLGSVGCASHVAGIRKMQMHGAPRKLAERMVFSLGIFCGGNRSYKAAEYLIAKFTGVPFENIANCEWRGGAESQECAVTTRDGKRIKIPNSERLWAFHQTRRERCLMCWDFTAETADISLGDIFVPLGTLAPKLPKMSAMIVRTKQGEALIDGAQQAGYLQASSLSVSGLAGSQGLELKKRFGAMRIEQRKKYGWPTPDFHYDVKYEQPEFMDKKAMVLQQMDEVPEIREWLRRDLQDPKYQGALKSAEPDILKAMKEKAGVV